MKNIMLENDTLFLGGTPLVDFMDIEKVSKLFENELSKYPDRRFSYLRRVKMGNENTVWIEAEFVSARRSATNDIKIGVDYFQIPADMDLKDLFVD